MKMEPKTNGHDPELATGWPVSKVGKSLDAAEKAMLIQFLKRRYEERFLNPIQTLRSAPKNSHGCGFAVMALCSLLIETIQCYRQGFPTTSQPEFDELRTTVAVPSEYHLPKVENGRQVFKRFFSLPVHRLLFCGVDGEIFYDKIRNGLVHQAQTKSGWKIEKGQTQLWNAPERIVDSDQFASALESAFNLYIDELSKAKWDDKAWKRARRKIWWLIKSG